MHMDSENHYLEVYLLPFDREIDLLSSYKIETTTTCKSVAECASKLSLLTFDSFKRLFIHMMD